MSAARCSLCNANFPLGRAGQECPICKLDTLEGLENDVPDPDDDLVSRINEADFQRYLEAHDRA